LGIDLSFAGIYQTSTGDNIHLIHWFIRCIAFVDQSLWNWLQNSIRCREPLKLMTNFVSDVCRSLALEPKTVNYEVPFRISYNTLRFSKVRRSPSYTSAARRILDDRGKSRGPPGYFSADGRIPDYRYRTDTYQWQHRTIRYSTPLLACCKHTTARLPNRNQI
jgi:hypothetical protein